MVVAPALGALVVRSTSSRADRASVPAPAREKKQRCRRGTGTNAENFSRCRAAVGRSECRSSALRGRFGENAQEEIGEVPDEVPWIGQRGMEVRPKGACQF